jgi:hypothetical protein
MKLLHAALGTAPALTDPSPASSTSLDRADVRRS